jgi:microcystin-dependent protein
MEGYIAEIRMFAGNFAPRTWAFCAGQTISIASNTALFSLLGVTFGGNGTVTFGLPDLRGRVPVGAGQGPGLPNVVLGEVSGSPTQTLTTSQMPAHNHTVQLQGSSAAATSNTPAGNYLAVADDETYDSVGPTVAMAANAITVGVAGGSQPFSIMQPYLGMNFIICQFGIFPSRN